MGTYAAYTHSSVSDMKRKVKAPRMWSSAWSLWTR